MRKKWGNLRDSYRKYKRKTKQSSGVGAKKIKKFIYADFLVFLDSTFEQRETDSNYSQEDNDTSISSVHSIIDIENSETNKYSRKKKSKTNKETDDEAQSILDFIKLKSKSEDEDYHFAMSLVPEIKRVPWQHKLNLKSEINLLISKYQQLSQSGPQSNNSGVPRYEYYHRPLEHDDNFSQFIHQSQQLLHTSDYNQIPPNYRNSSQHYSQHFTGTQPSTSQLFQQTTRTTI
ncbi:BESS domain-containing protein [Aphis craccivora]|uniref:BESS domain-containing protein n=1 Tax=Aphis craccivora TaxID=307492 RepID=A0A6G0Y800_APHCR|nr:BESS domain-containing protein [Aphis craccivora]